MSTPRTLNSRGNKDRGEMETCVGCKNRSIPDLLRLDSTGEVSSAKAGQQYRSPLVTGVRSDNLGKKQSMMNSIGAYFGSAASYLERVCPQQTMSKGLVENYSNRHSGLFQDYLVKGSNSANKMNSMKQEDYFDSCPPPSVVRTDRPVHCHWAENLLCALHSSLLNTCTSTQSIMSKHPGAQKYVPPQRRCGGSYEVKPQCATVDPKLTPYNARLLQKSKKCHSDITQSCKKEAYVTKSDVKNLCVLTEKFSEPCQAVNSDVLSSASCTEKNDLLDKTCGKDNVEVTEIKITACNDNQAANETQNETETKTTDWFEYDSRPDENSCTEPVYTVSQKYIPPAQGKEDDDKQLHNWFSVETDVDVNRNVEGNFDESSQTSEIPSNVCDTDKQDNNSEKCRLSENHDFNVELDFSSKDKVKVHVSPMQQKHKDSSAKCGSDGATQQALVAVLYNRNCGKKNRPSAKKRRKHKAQQKGEPNKVTITAENKNIESKNKLNISADQHPTSVVAFILGHDDSEDSDEDIDSDSDWSDDFDDENLSSLDDVDLNSCDIGFRCTDPLVLSMSCSVLPSCSIQPTQPTEKENDENSIDKINMMWKVQVSVDNPIPKRKSTASKKVHFADSESIATVHPMVSWCYAYQAARKGPWEQYARDRARFNRRITETENVLKPILQQKHRDFVYTERFADES